MRDNRGRNLVILTMVAALVGALIGAFVVPQYSNPKSYVGDVCFQHRSAIEDLNGRYVFAIWPQNRNDLDKQRSQLFADAATDNCASAVAGLPGAPEGFGGRTNPPATPSPAPSSAPSSAPPSQAPATPAPSGTVPPSNGWIHWFTKDQGKLSPHNFGTPVTATTAKQVFAEFERRIMVDPSLNCEDGGMIIRDQDNSLDCTNRLMQSRADNEAYAQRVMNGVKSYDVVQAYAQSGKVNTSYMSINQDGVPVVVATPVPRAYDYKVLVVNTTQGDTFAFVLLCGFQWEEGTNFGAPHPTATPTPAPKPTPRPNKPTPAPVCANGGERVDGVCVPPKVDVCRNVDGKWQVVRNVVTRKGDLQPDDAKCNDKPAPVPTTAKPSTTQPTPTPTPEPTKTSTPPAPKEIQVCRVPDGGGDPVIITIPESDRKSTDTSPIKGDNGVWICEKTAKPQPTGVASPTNNPPAPTAEPSPTKKPTPLQPTTAPSTSTSSPAPAPATSTTRAMTPPDQGGTPTANPVTP